MCSVLTFVLIIQQSKESGVNFLIYVRVSSFLKFTLPNGQLTSWLVVCNINHYLSVASARIFSLILPIQLLVRTPEALTDGFIQQCSSGY
jgi:hypothetical protein